MDIDYIRKCENMKVKKVSSIDGEYYRYKNNKTEHKKNGEEEESFKDFLNSSMDEEKNEEKKDENEFNHLLTELEYIRYNQHVKFNEEKKVMDELSEMEKEYVDEIKKQRKLIEQKNIIKKVKRIRS